jgi:hypothetical protein
MPTITTKKLTRLKIAKRYHQTVKSRLAQRGTKFPLALILEPLDVCRALQRPRPCSAR